jgi:hypothetical protein
MRQPSSNPPEPAEPAAPPSQAPRSLGDIYLQQFDAGRRERMFLSSISFFGTFAGVRALTHAIRRGVGPFHNLSTGGVHIHHAVWGILGLLGVGYAWNAEFGTGAKHPRASRVSSVLYGAAAALTLDEFALWLNLKDVYWAKQGRESVDAAVLFGGLTSVAWWGGPFIRECLKEARKLRRRV